MSPQAAFKLVAFFKSLGVHYVFDTTFSRDFSLIERYVPVLVGHTVVLPD